MATLSDIQLDLLKSADLKNEEIVELVSMICEAESIDPYREHLQIVREKYDMTLEVRPLDLEILSLREKFDVDKLRKYYQGAGDQSFYSLMPEFITTYQTDKNASVYLQNLEEVFGVSLDENYLRELLNFIESSEVDGPGASAIERHFRNKLERVAEYAPIPDYIKDFDIEIKSLFRLEDAEIDQELPDEYIADYLLNQLSDYAVVEAEDQIVAKETLVKRLQTMRKDEREQFIDLFKVDPDDLKRVRADRDVFRVYGPVNPYPNTDFSLLTNDDGTPNVNVVFGGARMFTDLDLEYDYDADLPLDDWFLGYCLECSKRIRSYHYALREPVIQGGWKGCYCSWDCLLKRVAFENEAEVEANPDYYNVAIVRQSLILAVKQDIESIGIADRDYEEKEEEAEGAGIGQPDYDQDAVDDLLSKLPKI